MFSSAFDCLFASKLSKRNFSFSNKIIPLWNSLPDNIVSSPTLNTFKTRLDKFWENQDVRYNWKADNVHQSRSKVE